jgi:mRNA interferase MazF
MARGDIILVPFPFTDLIGQKRRPALVVSPGGFDPEDLILCAITSRVPGQLFSAGALLRQGLRARLARTLRVALP